MSSAPFELGNSIVRAGAGTGKTRGLVEKIVEIYRKYSNREGGPPRIVLTTFTRKATQELKERLILRACSEKDADLLQFVSDPAKLQISTIHGLLNLFLQQVGHLAGLDSGFQIISEPEGELLSRLAFREVIAGNGEASRWLQTYGFDRTLEMCRLYQFLKREQGELRPGQLEDLELLANTESSFWRKVIHDLAAEIDETTDEKSWVKYSDDLKNFIATWSGGPEDLKLPRKPSRSKKQEDLEPLHLQVEEVIGDFKKKMDQPCWNSSLWPQMIAEWEEFQILGERFASELEDIKSRQGRYEMSDLELKSFEILKTNPFLSSVFAENWDYWMIDEYQDTSPLQVAILKALIGDKPRYLVGDPQQSIYLFRGAEVGVFKAAEAEMKPNERYQLLKNYRSQPELLLWANDFMAAMSSSFQRMEPRDVPNPKNSSVTFWKAPDPEAELKGLVAQVQKLLRGGARLDEICVLGRTHRNLMQVSRAFKEFGLPTHVHASRGFSTRREVLDARALWKFLVNPHDNLNLLMLLRSPWFFVEDWQLAEWMESRPQSLWRKIVHLEVKSEVVTRLQTSLEQVAGEGIVRTFEKALCSNGYLDLSLTNDPAGRKESNLWKLIHKAQALEKEGGQSILDLMQGEADNPLDANEGDATSAQEPNSINLMTIHGAKGLEFDHVLLPAMGEAPLLSRTQPLHAEEGIFHFPLWDDVEGEFVSSPLDFMANRRKRQREFEELDRWLYVALTRAKKSLTLSWSKVDRDSWASRNSWFTKQKGEHQTSNYIYEVVEEMPEPEMYTAEDRAIQTVRAPYANLKSLELDPRKSVTELVESKVRVKLSGDDMLKRWQAQTTGTRMHRAFEALKYQDAETDDESAQYVLSLKSPPIRDLIQNGEVEWGFHVQASPGNVIEGQIDLWGKHDGKLYVVDYKSGSQAYKEGAFTQLGLYAWALRKFGHKEPIELVVIYPRQKKLETRAFEKELFLHWENEFSGS